MVKKGENGRSRKWSIEKGENGRSKNWQKRVKKVKAGSDRKRLKMVEVENGRKW